jgi:hypothetical protein
MSTRNRRIPQKTIKRARADTGSEEEEPAKKQKTEASRPAPDVEAEQMDEKVNFSLMQSPGAG